MNIETRETKLRKAIPDLAEFFYFKHTAPTFFKKEERRNYPLDKTSTCLELCNLLCCDSDNLTCTWVLALTLWTL